MPPLSLKTPLLCSRFDLFSDSLSMQVGFRSGTLGFFFLIVQEMPSLIAVLPKLGHSFFRLNCLFFSRSQPHLLQRCLNNLEAEYAFDFATSVLHASFMSSRLGLPISGTLCLSYALQAQFLFPHSHVLSWVFVQKHFIA